MRLTVVHVRGVNLLSNNTNSKFNNDSFQLWYPDIGTHILQLYLDLVFMNPDVQRESVHSSAMSATVNGVVAPG